MEIWDVYDVHKRIIKNREVVRELEDFNEGEYHLVTVGWIYNSKGELLLQKRAANKVYPLIYANHGGSALKGETSVQSMIREIYEEIGIRFCENELVFLRSFIEGVTIFDEYIVHKNIEIGNLQIDYEEVESCQWFTLEEMNDLIDQKLCFNYRENSPNGMASLDLIKNYINKRKIG